MITVIILVGTGLAFILLLLAARGSSPSVTTPEEIQHLTTAVDLAAFRNLIDPEEEFFLRVHLCSGDYKRVKAARQRATLEYVKAIAHNAAVLVRLAENAGENAEPEVMRAARQLGNSAIQLRLVAIAAMLRLYACIFIPRLSFGRWPLADRYQQLTMTLVYYVSLCQPSQTSTISAAL